MAFSTIFSIVGWVLLIGLGLYVFYVVSMRSQRRPAKVSAVVVAVLLIGGIAMLTLGAGLVFIDQFESGVVISPLTAGGVRPEPIGPGIHFVTPFIESVDRFSTAKQEYTMSGTINEGAQQGNDAVEARTSDGQQVYIDATVRFYVDPLQGGSTAPHLAGSGSLYQRLRAADHAQCDLQHDLALSSGRCLRRQAHRTAAGHPGSIDGGICQAGAGAGRLPTAQHHLLAGVCAIDRAEADRAAAIGTGEAAGAEEPAGSRSAPCEGQRRSRCRRAACDR